ncbi:electron transfer flavoprotein subunit beta/FixA family protein [Corynebacterium matruchotii]|uniref:electron transfer flavoprotein subunit beta/FixA family protein n=1 Tax=Corynebacterium matruchotii TaxID=43768 RepID=UPI0028E934E8|nr:electron transfer flavoprotein subunit beta/FixA family protein [Corynebacterium matruchotii]
MPAIVVLVKNVPDTWSTKSLTADFTLDREAADNVIDEINEFAVEQALRLREANPEFTVVALSAGPAGSEEALRKALAMGADDAVLLIDDALAGSDILGTAWALTNALQQIPDVSLIISGVASSDAGTGALTGVLAEYRNQPALTACNSVSIESGVVKGVRETAEGHFNIEAPLPAIVSVTDQADKPRFPNFKGIMAAKKAEIRQLELADIGVDPQQVGLGYASTAVTAAVTRPVRTQGEIIRDEPAAAAARIVDYLVAEKLIADQK